MVKLYRNVLGKKGKFLGSGRTLEEAVEYAYNNGFIQAYNELYMENEIDLIIALTNYVFCASQDYIIERV